MLQCLALSMCLISICSLKEWCPVTYSHVLKFCLDYILLKIRAIVPVCLFVFSTSFMVSAEEVFVQLIGKWKLLQYKRQLLVCKLVEKKSQLQAQIESSARKTLKFPETKWVYQATYEYNICNAGSGSVSLVLAGYCRGEESFYLSPTPGLSPWARLAHDSREELLSQSQTPQSPQAK